MTRDYTPLWAGQPEPRPLPEEHKALVPEAGPEEERDEDKIARLDERIRKAVQRLEHLETRSRRPALGKADDAPETGGSFGDYLRKGMVSPLEMKRMSVGQDPQGGWLVPPAMASSLVRTLQQHSFVRHLATTVTITTDALEMLVDKEKAAVGWASEYDERLETETPDLARVRIPVHEMYARPRCTQQLLDDASIDVESWLTGKIAESMAAVENSAFVHGDGVGKPRGFLGYPLSPLGESRWGHLESRAITADEQGFAQLADALTEIVHSLKPGYLAGASWVMSRSAVTRIRLLKDRTEHYLWQPALAASDPSTLLGYPVHVMDDMPELAEGKAGVPAAFGNFRHGYTIVDRSGLSVLRDPYTAKPWVEFYATRRTGGDVVNFEAVRLLSVTA